MNDKISLKWLLENIFKYFQKTKSPQALLLGGGITILAGQPLLPSFSITLPTKYGTLIGEWLPMGESSFLYPAVGIALIFIAAYLSIRKFIHEEKLNEIKRVHAMELRGLDIVGYTPLNPAVSNTKKRIVEGKNIDIRTEFSNGLLTKCLNEINQLPRDIKLWANSSSHEHTTNVLGGIMPVPFSFLAGMLLDDEHHIELWDWHRYKKQWLRLSNHDDGKRFQVTGLEDLAENTHEVILATSTSYHVDLPNIKKFQPNLPIIEATLERCDFDCHWSEDKQQALAQEFSEIIRQLKSKHVRKIHLFLAGANSLVLRLGMAYDKRNFPECIIYQYEYSSSPAYPWGIQLPTHGISQAQIVSV